MSGSGYGNPGLFAYQRARKAPVLDMNIAAVPLDEVLLTGTCPPEAGAGDPCKNRRGLRPPGEPGVGAGTYRP